MNKIPFTKSLFNFNLRVLVNGNHESSNNIEELQRQLFFNQIFMSNTDEMFEKYKMDDIVDVYIQALGKVIQNIGGIIYNLMNLTDIGFTREDSFERRFKMNSELKNIFITNHYSSINEVHYHFDSGKIYYISTFANGSISVSTVDQNRAIYNKFLSMNNLYWKTDDCIRDYINDQLDAANTCAVKITTERKNSNMITKVEYNGESRYIQRYVSMFGRNALMIENPFLYTKDIELMIDSFIPKKKESQIVNKLNVQALMKTDKIIEYPTESFISYLEFLKSAVMYKDTSGIYLTLYRIGSNPELFYILKRAIDRGIGVHVNIELCASGEEINKFWMDEMIKIGIDVTTYELGNLKVHSKLTLIKFNNGKYIAQIGTGNYNYSTTSQYTDLSLITTDNNVCENVMNLFDIFRGKGRPVFDSDLLVTQYNARSEICRLIEEEGNKGKDGYICIKCNALSDDEIISYLDEAGKNGCIIILIIRGVCTWVPQYDNVMVKSVIWNKLEHSRVYTFGKTNPSMYIGSLDLVTSKLDKRIETMARVNNVDSIMALCVYLNRYITGNKGSWVMNKNGKYIMH